MSNNLDLVQSPLPLSAVGSAVFMKNLQYKLQVNCVLEENWTMVVVFNAGAEKRFC